MQLNVQVLYAVSTQKHRMFLKSDSCVWYNASTEVINSSYRHFYNYPISTTKYGGKT